MSDLLNSVFSTDEYCEFEPYLGYRPTDENAMNLLHQYTLDELETVERVHHKGWGPTRVVGDMLLARM